MDHNPVYNISSPALTKWRGRARDGLKALPYAERRAYGAAVHSAVLAAQRREANYGFEPINPKPRCASRSWATTGEAIHAAVLKQQRDAALAAPGQIRRARDEIDWERMYLEAMAEKRARQSEREAA